MAWLELSGRERSLAADARSSLRREAAAIQTFACVTYERLTVAWPELADLLRDADRYALRCIAAEVSLLAAQAASVADLQPIGGALDRLRSAPVIERVGSDALAPIRPHVRDLAEESRQGAVGDGVSPTDEASRQAHAVAAVDWALHPDPGTAASGATYEAPIRWM